MAMLDCGHEPTPKTGVGTGYGKDSEERTYCYACCATRDRADMLATGRATLYLNTAKREITNWPGSLRFPTGAIRTSRHNIAGKRYDTWFSVDGMTWHAVQYGDNTMLAHCRRTKEPRYRTLFTKLSTDTAHRV